MKKRTFTVKPPRTIEQLDKLIKKVKPKLGVQGTIRENRYKVDLEVKV